MSMLQIVYLLCKTKSEDIACGTTLYMITNKTEKVYVNVIKYNTICVVFNTSVLRSVEYFDYTQPNTLLI